MGACGSGFLHHNNCLHGRNQEAERAWMRPGKDLPNLERPVSSDLLPTVRPSFLRGPPQSQN